jgi:hypothetical protein
MKTPLIIFGLIVLVLGGALSLMNSACKSDRYSWCAPKASAPQLSILKRWPAG